MKSKRYLKYLLLALVALITYKLCAYMPLYLHNKTAKIMFEYNSYRNSGEKFENRYHQPVEMTQTSGPSHKVTSNTSPPSTPGDVSGSKQVICDNLSHVSISHMRAVSAQWQQIEENVTCYFYSAFWETRMTLKEVRVLGMIHPSLLDAIWCQLWYEGQRHPEIVKAITIYRCPQCKR